MPRKNDSPPRAIWPRAILEYIANHPARPLKARGLARVIGIANEDYADFRTLLREMLDDGRLSLGRGRILEIPEQARTLQGVFHASPRGDGYIESPGFASIYVPRHKRHEAADGDRVEAQIVKPRRPNQPLRAFITRILAPARVEWVGVLEKEPNGWIVRPQGRTTVEFISIMNPEECDSKPGDLVVVEPVAGARYERRARGRIVDNLGDSRLPSTLIRGVIRRYEFAESFSAGVERDAASAATCDWRSAANGREDLRRRLTLTIDPADARDFDDAISITQLPNDGYELGVHIADVGYFVPPGSELDAEARRRGTSVYFPDRVVPMLPARLSNETCSLQPDQPRLTKSVFMTYDKTGRVRGTRFANSIIRSDARLTYDQVTQVIENKDINIPDPVRKLLLHAERLARRIQKRRLEEGMIVLTAPELEIQLAEDGLVRDIRPEDQSFSHTIIEMFMVEANEAVSRLLSARGMRHLRRIHPDPEPDDLGRLSRICTALGHSIPAAPTRGRIQSLLNDVRGTPAESAVNLHLLRSLAQASYSPEPIGHYALASRHYCHFTSPIRRYPDLTVHRLLDAYLRDGAAREDKLVEAPDADGAVDIAMLGAELSAAERRAQQAEREARRMLALRWLKSGTGRLYDGIVSGFSKAGLFIQLQPILVDGLMPLEHLGSTEWIYDSENLQLVNFNQQRAIAIGHPVRVAIDFVDEIRQQLWLRPAKNQPFGTALSNQMLTSKTNRRKRSTDPSQTSRRTTNSRRGRTRRTRRTR